MVAHLARTKQRPTPRAGPQDLRSPGHCLSLRRAAALNFGKQFGVGCFKQSLVFHISPIGRKPIPVAWRGMPESVNPKNWTLSSFPTYSGPLENIASRS